MNENTPIPDGAGGRDPHPHGADEHVADRHVADEHVADRVRQYAGQTSQVPVPDLQTLLARSRRHRLRWLPGVAAAALVALGSVGLWQVLSSADSTPVAGEGPIAEVFDVPTYDWDGAGMDALVSGVLAFTDDGCPLMVAAEQATPVVFPDAVGVRYQNGVRAIAHEDGRVFAIEGQEFSYAGGYGDDPRWSDFCGGEPAREGAVVNDDPAQDALSSVPPIPQQELPDAPSSDAALGYFEVPTFEWDGEDGGDGAVLTGTLTFDGDCPVVVAHVEGSATRVGALFPHAEGHRNPDDPSGAMVRMEFPDGSGMGLLEGEPIEAGGGYGPSGVDTWQRLCGEIEVDDTFMIMDTDPTGDGTFDFEAAGVSSFDIATFDLADRDIHFQALIHGVLTSDSFELSPPVTFPNAIGVEYPSGVRAIAHQDGRIYAIEGRPFVYGGGAGEVHDEPALPFLTIVPPLPDGEPIVVPTRVVAQHETGGEPLSGTLAIDANGCATIETSEETVGIVLPNAVGLEQDDGSVTIETFTVDGTVDVHRDGDTASLIGTFEGAGHPAWHPMCGAVDAVLLATGS